MDLTLFTNTITINLISAPARNSLNMRNVRKILMAVIVEALVAIDGGIQPITSDRLKISTLH